MSAGATPREGTRPRSIACLARPGARSRVTSVPQEVDSDRSAPSGAGRRLPLRERRKVREGFPHLACYNRSPPRVPRRAHGRPRRAAALIAG